MLLTWLLMGEVGLVVLGDRYGKLDGAQGWAAFLFASYLFGHRVFLLGSWLDGAYDWFRDRTLNWQIRQLARREQMLSWPIRLIISLVFKRERNLAVDRTIRIKQQALGLLQAKDAINTFQWSKALLNVESPASLAVVQRFEADSKFFRCFTVVLLILLVSWPWHQQWPPEGIPIVLALLVLALWRYMEQRFKSTNQAYWSVITLTAKEGKIALGKTGTEARNPSHAGGIVFRLRGGTAEYLLVEATNDADQWVLPKGHIKDDEQPRDTAVREVHEETGVWARIVADLGDATWSIDGAVVTTRFFIMQAVGRGLRKEKNREHVWLPLQETIAKASHLETCELLQAPEPRRSRPASASPALATPTHAT